MNVQTLEPGMAIDFARWVGIVNLRDCRGEVYECYWLKLPCFGMHWQLRKQRDEWSQLVLFWHGRTGLDWWWEPVR